MSMRNAVAMIVVSAPLTVLACGGPKEEAIPAGGPATTTAAAPVGGAAAGKGSASVSGKVMYGGTAPTAEKVKVSADPYCQGKHKEGLERYTVKVKDGESAKLDLAFQG